MARVCVVFALLLGLILSGNASPPCKLVTLLNGEKVPIQNCSRTIEQVNEKVEPSPNTEVHHRDAFGRPIVMPMPNQEHLMQLPQSPYPNYPGFNPEMCLGESEMTEQLIEILNTVLVNVKMIDDGVPVYLHNGQLMVNPNYIDAMKKRKDAAKRDNYFCPHDFEGRQCFRSDGIYQNCSEDSDCKNKDGYLRLCCMDYCASKKVCKPALAKVL